MHTYIDLHQSTVPQKITRHQRFEEFTNLRILKYIQLLFKQKILLKCLKIFFSLLYVFKRTSRNYLYGVIENPDYSFPCCYSSVILQLTDMWTINNLSLFSLSTLRVSKGITNLITFLPV